MKSTPHIVIIGAGPAGLGAGWRLTELGYTDFILYDKNPYVGGLAASFVDEAGFTWDIGGHVLHSHFPYFDAMFETVMKGQYYTHKRESWVWFTDRFVPFPFQNNLDQLPKNVMRDCENGLRDLTDKTPKNFYDWIYSTYGAGIADHFMIPYNRKVWAYPLEKMSYRWVADRVAPPDARGTSWGPNAEFRYPKKGGTGDIWKRVAERFSDHIHLNATVVGIDKKKRVVRFSDGTHEKYDVLFSSMPLDTIADVKLHASAVTVVGVGLQGNVPDSLRHKCWMYFPGDEPYFRATVLSNYSPYNAPKGAWSLLFEISSSVFRPLEKDAIQETLRSPLIPKGSKIVDVWKVTNEYGYPTPTLDRDGIVDPVLDRLEKQDVFSRGRFGMWKYEVSNQDHTFMQGVEWADYVHNNVLNKVQNT